MATRNILRKVFDLAEAFVSKQNGVWEHTDWEAFLESITRDGIPVTDETKRNLGNILEAGKYFLAVETAAPAMKKAPAKPKAKSRA